jgi:hypothetical protein
MRPRPKLCSICDAGLTGSQTALDNSSSMPLTTSATVNTLIPVAMRRGRICARRVIR